MIARLEEVDAVVPNEVDDAVLLGEAARPRSGCYVLQGLRLANPDEGVAENRLYEIQTPEGDPTIGLHPVSKVLSELRLKDRLSGQGLVFSVLAEA